MFCSKCGSQIGDGANACSNCGAPVTSTSHLQASGNPDEIIAEPGTHEVEDVQSLIPLTEGENILCHEETSEGLIHKKVVLEEAVTNKRCLKYARNQKVTAQIGISRWPEVVIMNLHRVNDSLGGGVFLTPRMFGLPGLGGFGVYVGSRRGVLKVFGDVCFMNQRKVIMTFENVKDPQSVKQLVEALKREAGFQGAWRPRPWAGQRFRPMQP